MALSDDDARAIREEIREGFRKALKDQGITLANHSVHHQWIANFISTCQTIRRAAIYSSVGVVITAVLGAVWIGIKGG